MGVPLRVPLGLVLTGYGLLVLAGVLPHDALWAGFASLAAGLILLIPTLPRMAPVAQARGRVVAAIGGVLAGGILLYNGLRGSGLSPPEWGILLYGGALLAAAPNLGRSLGPVPVNTLVGWSFPLLLAPLALFALNAAISAGTGETAASPAIQALIVAPASIGLALTGTDVTVSGSSLLIPTERGLLSLGIGLVCAGLYPIVLFAGLVGLHTWTERMPARKVALLVGAGVGGLYVLNLVRLVAIAKVGIAYGPSALQTAHENLGWILFALYMTLFWAVALRKGKAAPPPAAGP